MGVRRGKAALARERNIEIRWIGQRLSGPDIDFAKLADAQGAVGIGSVTDLAAPAVAIAEGVSALDAGGVAVVDIHVTPGQDRNDAMTMQIRA